MHDQNFAIIPEHEMNGIIFGEYDEALDRQEQEKYLKEETDAARSEGEKSGIEIGKEIGKDIGAKQKAIQMAESTIKRFPDWSDQEIADFVKDITAEEVAKLRREGTRDQA